jgi:hypothetical protein
MARLMSRFAAATALISALSMAVTPASAAPLHAASRPLAATAVAWQGWSPGNETANNHRDYRGYRDYRHYRRHGGGLDTGDVIAGVLVLGGIAAIASAASNNSQRQRETTSYPDYRDSDYRQGDYRDGDNPSRDRPYDYRGAQQDNGSRYSDGRGMDRAADMCVREVEQREQVGEVGNVARTANGWRVDGSLRSGRGFTCEIGNDGRIADVQVDSASASSGGSGSDRQWQDDDYARAREQSSDQRTDDGRYRTADVPDF